MSEETKPAVVTNPPAKKSGKPSKAKRGPRTVATAQIGTALKIGFSTNVYTGYIMQDFDTTPSGNQDAIPDEDNATVTVLVSNLGTEIKFNAIIKGTGSLTPPAKGSTVTINSVGYRCLESSVKQVVGASILSFHGIKEASMTYT